MITISIDKKKFDIDTNKVKYSSFLPIVNYKFNMSINIHDEIEYDSDPDIFEKFILPISYNDEIDMTQINYYNISHILSNLLYYGLYSIFDFAKEDSYYNDLLMQMKIINNIKGIDDIYSHIFADQQYIITYTVDEDEYSGMSYTSNKIAFSLSDNNIAQLRYIQKCDKESGAKKPLDMHIGSDFIARKYITDSSVIFANFDIKKNDIDTLFDSVRKNKYNYIGIWKMKFVHTSILDLLRVIEHSGRE